MKLFDTQLAPNPRRVRVFMAEKGIEIERVNVDLGKMEQKSAEFTALNPRQRTPVLELDDGTRLCESVAICRYLEALQPEPNLFRTHPVGDWGNRDVGTPVGARSARNDCRRLSSSAPGHGRDGVPQVKEWGERNKARIVGELTFLDHHLKGREFVAAGRFTNADITGMIAIDFLRPTRVAIPDDLADLRRWHAAVSSRPSARA